MVCRKAWRGAMLPALLCGLLAPALGGLETASAAPRQAKPPRTAKEPRRKTPVPVPPPVVEDEDLEMDGVGDDDGSDDADEGSGDGSDVRVESADSILAETVEDLAAEESEPRLGVRVAVGVGVTGRAFDPGPQTLTRYRSTPVATARFDLGVEPHPGLELMLTTDRTLSMSTSIADEDLDTSISLWQVTSAWTRPMGGGSLGAVMGVGRRRFTIESKSLLRSPDGDYQYFLVGARAAVGLGRRAVLRVSGAFEPVYGGNETTEMAFGPGQRWGLALGATVDIRATQHLAVKLAAEYQGFVWQWPTAGVRGEGGALDHYPTAVVSLNAGY